MNRLLGLASAMLLTLLVLVPATAAAAEPFNTGSAERVIFASGADFTLPAAQSVDTLVVNGLGMERER